MAAFYEDSKKREVDTVRFAFCKTEADLEKAYREIKVKKKTYGNLFHRF